MTGEPIPLVDMQRLHAPLLAELRDAIDRVLVSGRYASGPEAEALEEELAAFVGCGHAVAVGSGTAALHLMLLAAGIGPGDEVILPTNTFFATLEAVHHVGATPVLVDVLETTANIDPDAVAAACGPRAAAVIAVHLYGQPAAVEELESVTSPRGLLLLEDAAQAIGARWLDRSVGDLGLAAGFSFYPGKNLGALGEAGAITTSDAALADTARLLRNHGSRERYIHEICGFNERIDELQAAALRVKLRHLPAQQAQRDAALETYVELLASVPGTRRIETDPRARSVSHLLVVQVPERDAVVERLNRVGIGAAIHYPVPLHRQPAIKYLAPNGSFPVADRLADSILSLPLFPGISEPEIQRCVDALRDAVDDATNGSPGPEEDLWTSRS